MSAILPLVSSMDHHQVLPQFVIIGTPGDRRVELFQQALSACGLQSARLVSYLDLLAGNLSFVDMLTPATIVRIESPGKSQQVERALLALGAELADPDDEDYEPMSRRMLDALPFEKGQLLPSRQWYLGYRHLLKGLMPSLNAVRLMNRPEDILLMFDKQACHRFLSQHQIAVPSALDPIQSYDQMMSELSTRRWSRVFIKPAHGSSASGVIAYRFQGARHQAITTIEMVPDGLGWRFYNTRNIRTYTNPAEIAILVNMLCRQRVHVEQWIPKASVADKVFDCRIVVIAGQACHIVMRMSKSPMTNLHLLNQRGDVDALQEMIGADNWQAALHTCEQAASLFHDNLYAGVDLLFAAHNYQRHAILEMNAFGDLLPGVLHQSEDTYSAEIAALLKGAAK
jgi:hypothetical protein